MPARDALPREFYHLVRLGPATLPRFGQGRAALAVSRHRIWRGAGPVGRVIGVGRAAAGDQIGDVIADCMPHPVGLLGDAATGTFVAE